MKPATVAIVEIVSNDEAAPVLGGQQLSNQNYEFIEKILNNRYIDQPQQCIKREIWHIAQQIYSLKI